MRKYEITLINICLLTLIVACKNNLNLKPQGALTHKDIVSDSTKINMFMTGVYSMLGGYHSNSGGSTWMTSATNWTYGDVPSDDAYKGSNEADQSPLLEIETFQHNAANVYFNAKWKVLYESISRANRALKFIKEASLSEAQKKNKEAQIRFLRGHFYFEAYRMWKNIPYIDENTQDPLQGNTTVDVLEKIIQDFKFAKDNLSNKKDNNYGIPNKHSASAYLGKVYLYKAGYINAGLYKEDTDAIQAFTDAKTEFDFVLTGGYRLLPEYKDIYNPTVEASNSEGVFGLRNSINDGAPFGENADLGSELNYIHNYTEAAGCCGFFVPSENLVNAHKTRNGLPIDDFTGANANEFNNDNTTGGKISDYGILSLDPFTPFSGHLDPRLDYTVGRRGIPFLDYKVHPGSEWARSPEDQGNYTRKKRYFKKEWIQAGLASISPRASSIDYFFIRYADVLLMLAECEVEVGSLARARELVNQVRSRAKDMKYLKNEKGTTNAANYNIEIYSTGHMAFSSKENARKTVRFERRLELAFEGHRFFDLVRWGVADSVINNYKLGEPVSYASKINFIAGKNEFFPIPQAQIDLSQKKGKSTLTQNENY